MLQSEVSPARARGRFVCFQLSLLNLGIFIAYWVGYGFTPMTGSKAWRIPVALQAIFIVPMLVLVFIVPESPRWLASHGRAEESLAVIARLQNKPTTHHDVLTQHKEIQDAVELERSIGSGTWGDLLKEDRICSRRRLLIACSIQFFQQVGGINAIIFYAGNFFSLVSDKASLLAGGLFTWFFVASFIPWFLIDTAGRRKLLLTCVTGMALAFAVESALVWKVQTQHSKAAAGAAIAVLFVYMGLFTVSVPSACIDPQLTLDRLPSSRLGLPVRDPAAASETKGFRHLHCLQLDHQLHDRSGRPTRCQESGVEVLHCGFLDLRVSLTADLCCNQRRLPAADLPVLPRDHGLDARGGRSPLQQDGRRYDSGRCQGGHCPPRARGRRGREGVRAGRWSGVGQVNKGGATCKLGEIRGYRLGPMSDR